MYVLEPSPTPPRRAATRADGGDAPDAAGAGTFDVGLTEAEAKDRAVPDGTAVALAAAAVPARQPPVPAGAATPAAPAPPAAPPAAAAVPGPHPGPHPGPFPGQYPAPASSPSVQGVDTAASHDDLPVATAPAREGTGPDVRSAPVSPERLAAAPTSPALPADAGSPDSAAAAPAEIAAPPRRADALPLGRQVPAAGAGESTLHLAAAQPDAAAAAPHLAFPEAHSASAPSTSALAAPAEAAAPPRPANAAAAATDARAVCGQVAVAVATSDDSRIEIRLDPPELGRVHIHLTTSDGGVQALVAAQRPETQDFLRRHADTLAQELAAAGYGDVSLAFSSGEDASPGRNERPPADWQAVGLAAAERPAAAPAPRTTARGALDIRL